VKSKRLVFTEDPFHKETALDIAIIQQRGNNIVLEDNLAKIQNPDAKFLVSVILNTIDEVTYESLPSGFGPHFTLK
jgi:hypothetical protein